MLVARTRSFQDCRTSRCPEPGPFPDRQRPPVPRLGLGVDMSKQLAIEHDALYRMAATCTATLPLVTRKFLLGQVAENAMTGSVSSTS